MTRHIGSCINFSGVIRKILGRYEGRKIGLLPFAEQTVTCHAELVSASCNRDTDKTLKRVQGDKAAFTLAEVLITLGIIGIVAALTMPSLIQNYKRKIYSTRLKETYSILSQAIKLSEIDNGPSSTWIRARGDNYTDGQYDDNKNTVHCYNFFMKYLAPYIKSDASDKNLTSREYKLPNGVRIFMHNGNNMDLYVYVDKPNHHGADLHYFAVKRTGGLQVGYGGNNREALKSLCKSSYSNGIYGVNNYWPYCTSLLMYDNWEFKDDFPLKL